MTTSIMNNAAANTALINRAKATVDNNIANNELSSGITDRGPAIKSLVAGLSALREVTNAALGNINSLSSVGQLGIKVLDNMIETVASLDALATQANDGTLTDKERSQINGVAQNLLKGLETAAQKAEFNGTKFFIGSAGTVDIAAASVSSSTAAVVVDTFVAGIKGDATGDISGTLTSAEFNYNATDGRLDLKETIGGQVFEALNVNWANDAEIVFVSISNPNNRYTRVLGADLTTVPVNDLTDAAHLASAKTAYETHTGTAPGVASVVQKSVTTAVNNGLTGMSVGTTAEPGTVTASYDGATNILHVQHKDADGVIKTQNITMDTAGAQDISTNFGVTLTFDAAFALATSVTQVVGVIAEGTEVKMTSQTGANSNDTTTLTFKGATLSALGLSNISLSTATDATTASDAFKAALALLTANKADVAAALDNLELKAAVLKDTANELSNVISGFQDADMPAAALEQALSMQKIESAGMGFAKALQQMQMLMKALQQA